MKKAFATWGILIVLLISIVGTAAAQSGEGPTATPTAVPTDVPTEGPTAVPTQAPGAKFFTHPAVQVLSAYFDRPRTTNPYQWTPTPDPLATVDPLATAVVPPASESGLGPIGEQIAAYHEEGMGFGQLVKVFAMVEASQEACGATPVPGAEPCTPLTADELVTSLQSGTGMGQLYKEYGKPALLGVGHVKKKVKEMGDQPVSPELGTTPDPSLEGTPVPAGAQPGKGNPGKGNNGKGNNGKGPKK